MDIVALLKVIFVVGSFVAITLAFIFFTKITISVFAAIIAINFIVALYKVFRGANEIK